ncbi:DUF1810 domain-containing protein [Mucilaginibacter koreensis]
MPSNYSLQRFVEAQQSDYQTALAEISNGRKRSHWMWYIFPQLKGLGFSSTSQYYGIQDIREAEAYLNHPVLGSRLVEICQALLKQPARGAQQVFGSPDDMKLRSSMTLFAAAPGANPVFQQVLNEFFGGAKDTKTLSLLAQ